VTDDSAAILRAVRRAIERGKNLDVVSRYCTDLFRVKEPALVDLVLFRPLHLLQDGNRNVIGTVSLLCPVVHQVLLKVRVGIRNTALQLGPSR
jgi:hypothetical protein